MNDPTNGRFTERLRKLDPERSGPLVLQAEYTHKVFTSEGVLVRKGFTSDEYLGLLAAALLA